jgi:hypothetical protein
MRSKTSIRPKARATAIAVAVTVLGLSCLAVSAPASAAVHGPKHGPAKRISAPAQPPAQPGQQGQALARAVAAASRAAGLAANAEPGRQAALVAGEDVRLMTAQLAIRASPRISAAVHPYRVRSAGFLTLVLTQRSAPYTFDDLRRLAPETLLPQADGSFLLREHIVVAAGATLLISPSQPLVVRMTSGPAGFVSLVSEGGRLRFNGTAAAPITFESWDETHGRQDSDVSDGRAYIRSSGQLVARYSTFSRLGFWSGRTGGVSVVGSASAPGKNVDARAASNTIGDPIAQKGVGGSEVLPAGRLPRSVRNPSSSFATQVSDVTMVGNAFGLFVSGNSGIQISQTVIRDSLIDGLVLHRNVDSATVDGVRVEQSGSDGVVVSRQVEGTVLTRLVVRRNGRDGIVMAGRPLARGASASGSSTRAFGNNVLTASESSDNAGIGVHVIGGTAVRVQGNVVSGGRAGIVVSDGASDIEVDSNRVAGAAANGIQVRESNAVTVTANVVRDCPTGIHVRNTSGLFRQNSTSRVTLHAITFVGRVSGSVAEQNQLAGSGTSAIDLIRVIGNQKPVLTNNDLSGWSRTVTGDSLISVLMHPLTVIWIMVGLLLLATSRPRRGGTRLPYPADPLTTRGGSRPLQPASVSLDHQVANLDREVAVYTIQDQPFPTPVNAMAEHTVIDLAIRDSRRNLPSGSPRRRRVGSR